MLPRVNKGSKSSATGGARSRKFTNLPQISDDDRRLRRGKRSKIDIPRQELDQLIRTLYFGNQMLNSAMKHGFREFAHVGEAEEHYRMLESLLQHSPAKLLRTYMQFNFMEWTAKLHTQIATTLNIVQSAVKRLVQEQTTPPKIPVVRERLTVSIIDPDKSEAPRRQNHAAHRSGSIGWISPQAFLTQMQQEMHKAVIQGDATMAMGLIKRDNVQVDFQDNTHHYTGLNMAAALDCDHMVEMFLSCGANPAVEGIDGTTALVFAAYHGNTELIQKISAVHFKRLMAETSSSGLRGLSPTAGHAMMRKRRPFNSPTTCIPQAGWETAVMIAAFSQKPVALLQLLRHKYPLLAYPLGADEVEDAASDADLYQRKSPSLKHSSKNIEIPTLVHYSDHGEEVDLHVIFMLSALGCAQALHLFLSCLEQRVPEARSSARFKSAKSKYLDRLVNKHCHVRRTDDAHSLTSASPLYVAAQQGHINCVRVLDHFARLKLNDRNLETGMTPLHAAALNLHVEVVLYLLERNVSVDVKTTDGFSALSLAIVGLGSLHERIDEQSEHHARSADPYVRVLLHDKTKPLASSRSFRRGVVMLSLLVTAGADPMQPILDTEFNCITFCSFLCGILATKQMLTAVVNSASDQPTFASEYTQLFGIEPAKALAMMNIEQNPVKHTPAISHSIESRVVQDSPRTLPEIFREACIMPRTVLVAGAILLQRPADRPMAAAQFVSREGFARLWRWKLQSPDSSAAKDDSIFAPCDLSLDEILAKSHEAQANPTAGEPVLNAAASAVASSKILSVISAPLPLCICVPSKAMLDTVRSLIAPRDDNAAQAAKRLLATVDRAKKLTSAKLVALVNYKLEVHVTELAQESMRQAVDRRNKTLKAVTDIVKTASAKAVGKGAGGFSSPFDLNIFTS